VPDAAVRTVVARRVPGVLLVVAAAAGLEAELAEAAGPWLRSGRRIVVAALLLLLLVAPPPAGAGSATTEDLVVIGLACSKACSPLT
jgi:threonine/homoserine efflux transporter RhtA